MNLKYYLRGLGIGVIVTAVIMSVTAGRRTETLSNAEIRERARVLGMVDPAGVLTELADGEQEGNEPHEEDAVEGPSATPTAEPAISPESLEVPEETEMPEPVSPEPEVSSEPSMAPTEEPEVSSEPSIAPTKEPEISPSPSPVATPAQSPGNSTSAGSGTPGTSVIIVVRSGESSYTVCKKLEDAGIVSSASAFDSYLCSRGYDTRLRAGSFEIPADADLDKIAQILISG